MEYKSLNMDLARTTWFSFCHGLTKRDRLVFPAHCWYSMTNAVRKFSETKTCKCSCNARYVSMIICVKRTNDFMFKLFFKFCSTRHLSLSFRTMLDKFGGILISIIAYYGSQITLYSVWETCCWYPNYKFRIESSCKIEKENVAFPFGRRPIL